MNRQIKWESGCYDEIELIYEKAENDKEIAEFLEELEERSINEAHRYCQYLNFEGKPLTTEQYDALSQRQKEQVICRLGEGGIADIDISMEEPLITVTFSATIQLVMGCTMFSLLNRLEKLDGSYNTRFPKAILQLMVPLSGRKGLFSYVMMILKMYPWLKVSEASTNTVAIQPE